ncbi:MULTISPECIES: hypothetical protein [unclassified Paenibacillus]|uniref:hypothetical protein n=1 Tax=unclassified Paenibacillus TaxID=185978 RepID=UPI000896DED4|nr:MULTISPECIES: hypothetical protein [unclassified Paenibacillus]SEB27657.1 hypothetical protein SAMN03159332_6334 [Paenibacillus sp. 276b]SLK16058.1 hypothetical protein SAMN06272722_11066 [Paenibacillus sp. RU5A]SOC74188.1 hypothetical protein SAMN05880581_11066 [Paenibacillus sp. RU26A]SOC76337.1 hypothetical protein SAMN05880586_11066 [Paenibacillus sp. RU5M]
MKSSDLFKLKKEKPIVVFTQKIDDYQTGFHEKMKARLVDMTDHVNGCYRLVFDLSEFENNNKVYEQPSYYDEKRNSVLRWSEINKNKLEVFFIDVDSEIDFLEIVSQDASTVEGEASVNDIIEQYKSSRERKQKILKPLHDKKKGLIDLTISESSEMLVLEAEIRLINEFLEDLSFFINDKQGI